MAVEEVVVEDVAMNLFIRHYVPLNRDINYCS